GNGVAESEVVDGGRVHTIQLDVLNATGETKLAQKMTDYLRSRGFDVVELGNHRGGLEKTLVIDRTGNTQAAVQVAEVLGVPREQVVQKLDKTLYLDVSVYIGNDYRALRPFR
ncbi:MAG: LytR C-terminal domain-containing protein, partial [Ignavibacteriales bacterium]|nr:LytR C-terminal domain-containing protein [Ignavibacteriales bacterium]